MINIIGIPTQLKLSHGQILGLCVAIQIKRRRKLLRIESNVKIVTQENKVKPNRIPLIAKKFGVKSLNLLEFFRDIGIG